jgi:hypothetical protein
MLTGAGVEFAADEVSDINEVLVMELYVTESQAQFSQLLGRGLFFGASNSIPSQEQKRHLHWSQVGAVGFHDG